MPNESPGAVAYAKACFPKPMSPKVPEISEAIRFRARQTKLKNSSWIDRAAARDGRASRGILRRANRTVRPQLARHRQNKIFLIRGPFAHRPHGSAIGMNFLNHVSHEAG